jgi:hypothetical protein
MYNAPMGIDETPRETGVFHRGGKFLGAARPAPDVRSAADARQDITLSGQQIVSGGELRRGGYAYGSVPTGQDFTPSPLAGSEQRIENRGLVRRTNPGAPIAGQTPEQAAAMKRYMAPRGGALRPSEFLRARGEEYGASISGPGSPSRKIADSRAARSNEAGALRRIQAEGDAAARVAAAGTVGKAAASKGFTLKEPNEYGESVDVRYEPQPDGSIRRLDARGQPMDPQAEYASLTKMLEESKQERGEGIMGSTTKEQKERRQGLQKRVDMLRVMLESTANMPMFQPKPGEVRDGFRFKGGEPGEQSNWERV